MVLTKRELSLCVKGVKALGLVWNKSAREATKDERKALEEKLLLALDQWEINNV